MPEARPRILAIPAAILACLLLAAPASRAADTAPPARASAGPAPPDLAAELASPAYDAVADAVERLGVAGGARPAAIVGALAAHRLSTTRATTPGAPRVFIRADGGALTDAFTGEAAAVDASSLRPVRMNNRVRGAVASAEGMLALASPDPHGRRAAADAIFEAHDPNAIPALDRALAREPDDAVRTRLRQARASCLLGDLDLRLWSVAQSVFYGLSLGSVLLLAAMGLAITFGVMGVINMAHGEIVMIGAYTTFLVQGAIASGSPALAPLGVLVAIPVAFAVCGALGIVIERTLIRFLYGRPLETLLATWGLSLILQQAVRSIFGPTDVAVSSPAWMSGAIALGGVTITLNRLAIMVFAVLVMAALMATLRATPLGLRMRAVTQNRRMAASMGIRTPSVDALTFGLGSGVAGLAGVALSQIDNVSPNLGQAYIIDSFMVVVFGGVGNLWGTLVGALSLGVLNKFLEPFAGAVLGKIVVLVVIIAFIQRRPRGLFPVRGRAAET